MIEQIDWTAYIAYKCDACTEDCINRRDSSAGQDRLCRSCYREQRRRDGFGVPANYETLEDGRTRWRSWYSGAEEEDYCSVHRLLATLLVEDVEELDGRHVIPSNGVKWDVRLDNLEIVEPNR